MHDYPPEILLNTAVIGIQMQTSGYLDEAISLYRELLEQTALQGEERSTVLWNLGSCLIQRERWSEAAFIFSQMKAQASAGWQERIEINAKICTLRAVNKAFSPIQLSSGRLTINPVRVRKVPGRIFRRPGSKDGYYDPDFCAFLETGAACGNDGRCVMFDIGANNGVLSTYAAMTDHIRPTVYAFEPNPFAFAELAANVQDEKLEDTVHCHPVAASDMANDDGELLTPAEHAPELSRLSGTHPVLGSINWVRHKIKIVTLDEMGLPDPSIIKIDAEDHEYQVLRGAARIIDRAKPVIYFENWLYGFNFTETLAPLITLVAQGYHLFVPLWQHGAGKDATLRAENPADGMENTRLLLNPISVSQRLSYKENTNLFAIHSNRLEAVKNRLQATT